MITIDAINHLDAINELRLSALKTIYNAIKNGIGGQEYCWAELYGEWYVICTDRARGCTDYTSMVCWKKNELNEGGEPKGIWLVQTVFDLEQLCKLAKSCTTQIAKCYVSRLYVNGGLRSSMRFDSRLAARAHKWDVSLAEGESASVVVDTEMDYELACKAEKQYRLEEAMRRLEAR